MFASDFDLEYIIHKSSNSNAGSLLVQIEEGAILLVNILYISSLYIKREYINILPDSS